MNKISAGTAAGPGESLKLYTPDGQAEPLSVRWFDGYWWLSLPKLQTIPVAVPTWTQIAFSQEPTRAAVAGEVDGYLVLEFDQKTPLAMLQVDIGQICRNSARAVIATQSGDTDFDFRLRYFAPQYGVNEDAVTGSAQRVLADYWSRRGDSFRVLQSSAAGGVILVRSHGNVVDIGGRVSSDSSF